MRSALLALLPFLVAAPALAADCTKDVLAAFSKQRASKVFRVEMTQPTAEGPARIKVDYMPPDKMLQTVTSPAMPGEQQTMLVGNRAFAGTSGAYEELLPQFTQSIVAEFVKAVGPPENTGQYECAGETKFENRDLVAYRLTAAAQGGKEGPKEITRTIYVDPANGLPAYNVVEAPPAADPVMKAAYTYPTDVEIVAPENAPVQKLQ